MTSLGPGPLGYITGSGKPVAGTGTVAENQTPRHTVLVPVSAVIHYGSARRLPVVHQPCHVDASSYSPSPYILHAQTTYALQIDHLTTPSDNNAM